MGKLNKFERNLIKQRYEESIEFYVHFVTKFLSNKNDLTTEEKTVLEFGREIIAKAIYSIPVSEPRLSKVLEYYNTINK